MAEFEYNILIIHNVKEVRDDLIEVFGGHLPQDTRQPDDMVSDYWEFEGLINVTLPMVKGPRKESRKLFIHTAASAREYRFRWRNHIHHVVLLNLTLPEDESARPQKEVGMDLLREIKQDHPDSEVIVFTEQMVLDRAIEAIENGAFYFIQQPHIYLGFVKTLVARIIQMMEGAYADPLTGLSNRRFFQSSLQNYWEEYFRISGDDRRERKGFLSLVMMDVDSFKRINDTHGHPEGDATLRFVAEMIDERFRKTDIKGRIGGDEFAVILPDTEHKDALNRAERLREKIKTESITSQKNEAEKEEPRTISAGVATFPVPNNVSDLEEFVKAADDALYFAKREFKKDCVCGYTQKEELASFSEIDRSG